MTDETQPADPEILDPAVLNPVTVARLQVEAQIPPEKRGPGWDRHWRELEHYAEAALEWSAAPAAPQPAEPRKRRRRRRNGANG